MLPSLLARDIQRGIKQFLTTGFEPSDAMFHGVMQRFVDEESAWMKGPYVQAGLPFRPGLAGRGFFNGFQTQFPGHSHQEAAWARLSSDRLAVNTLVATGTGSGKTECFLYPVLDYCARDRKAKGLNVHGQAGIKVLVIYPMNALASDQAKRFAQTIADTPAFAGLRVGLFVGGRSSKSKGKGSVEGVVMTPTSVITDRDTLRKHPPDILLTNYKMLDYLLIRPKDRQLWAHNQPDTLRYVVVDELHTFDGAQGTDLALLLRRLRARLKLDPAKLICTGTSATLGGNADSAPLRDYARQIFGSEFPEDSVITENRKSVAEFLGESPIEYVLHGRTDFETVLDPANYASQAAAVAAWYSVFFTDVPAASAEAVANAAWRAALGTLLKKHLLVSNLLKLLQQQKAGILTLNELVQAMQGPLPESARPHVALVLDALLVLLAWARDPVGNDQPLLTLRVQIWMRELRRMVAKVTADREAIKLRPHADLKAKPDGLYLPLVQCSECHTTGWLGKLPAGSNKLVNDLDQIYNAWFGHRTDAVRFYAPDGLKQPQLDGIASHICASCGNVQTNAGSCQACGHEELVQVFRSTGTKSSQEGNLNKTWHDGTCPACGAAGYRQILLGARNATLGAQVVEHGWASPFNDDKKLIAFSDSVQDAAHRAGFFGARTYISTVRAALARSIDYLAASAPSDGKPGLPWQAVLQRLPKLWNEVGSPLEMPVDRFVAEFIGPDMTWQRDWAEKLLLDGGLPANSRLPGRVEKRLAWQVFQEFTYLSQRGRNLDRLGKATLAPDPALIYQAVNRLGPVLGDKLGLRGVESRVLFQWLWGFVTQLRRRGAVMQADLVGYARDGNVYALAKTQSREYWMPKMGPSTPHPVFLTLGQQRDFDRLSLRQGKSWYERWAEATLGQQALLAPGLAEAAYLEAISALETLGVISRADGNKEGDAGNPYSGKLGDSIGLNPDALYLVSDVRILVTPQGKRELTIPASLADALLGMPCLDAPQEHYEDSRQPDSWLANRYSTGDLRRVIAAEHTGLLARDEREALEIRFKDKHPQPWFENLLSATPTLEMGVDIGDLSSVLLCSVPPNQASFLQRLGRAGRRDGNAFTATLADGNSPHDLYFFADTDEMLTGEVLPPGIFLKAAEVLRRQLFAYCMDDWVGSGIPLEALPDKTSQALDAVAVKEPTRFPFPFLDHVLKHEPRLLQEFIDLLAGEADDTVVQRLTAFMQGQATGAADLDDSPSLRVRTLKVFEELEEERASHKKRAEQIANKLKALKKLPRDEATEHEIDEMDRERQKALELVKEINQRELLNTLTDAGLIPNYAFPEAGVQLKSVLWRKKNEDDPDGSPAYISLPAIKYERPASSALSEFAPENRFYANQRKVEVDQINMALSSMDWWRLCPSCHHMENTVINGDSHGACPRCGDSMWADSSQKRLLLRFRQAIANSNDVDVRIDDSAEDREPKIYVRQLLVDFEREAIREAWQIKADNLPFGFEFIARATFRDVNFGEMSKPEGDKFRVADKDVMRPGFKLCKHCGKVQVASKRFGSRNGAEANKQQHAFDCLKRDADEADSIIDCLYLYREFQSEALRILVPYTQSGMDEEVTQSFMAALQLGLKKRFGGRVDHLRLTTQEEPGKDGAPKRQYVLLYDSVPGGTGYLHQLLAQDAHTLVEVLGLALQAINTCTCNQDPDKDGCYRCVYQYRLGRAMYQVSRNRAAQVLAELVAALDQLEKVPTISEIYINPAYDSVLEPRFVDSLARLGAKSGLPVKLVQEVVKGKTGFYLEVDAQPYWIEPQVKLGPDEGIAVCSEADFVIWPANSRSARRPIAVFCDGWAYHKAIAREDAQKRSAIVASGRFWVWSVTWDDVAQAMKGEKQSDLESPLTSMNRHDRAELITARLPEISKPWLSMNAVGLLLEVLKMPAESGVDPAAAKLKANTALATFLMIPPPGQATSKAAADALASAMQPRLAKLPDWMHNLPASFLWGKNKDGTAPEVCCVVTGNQMELPVVTGWLELDDLATNAAIHDTVQQTVWRRWLSLFNTFQTMPGVLLTTRTGIAGGDYVAISPATIHGMAGGNEIHATTGMALEALLKLAMKPVHVGLATLAGSGHPLPDEVGYELADAQGETIAEAELAWLEAKVVVLLDVQEDYVAIWLAQGWRVVMSTLGWEDEILGLINTKGATQ